MLNKIKDLIYNKNDLVVVLIILVLAALLILWRVDVIMDYPSTLVADADTTPAYEQADVPGSTDVTEPADGPDAGAAPQPPAEPVDGDLDGDGEVDICAVYINYGDSMDTIAANCVAAFLIDSTDEFYSILEAKGASESIQAGQHFIPANVTPDELIDYLCKPGM